MISNENKLGLSSQVKNGEIKLATFVAEHNIAFNVMEHLPKLIKSICPDSDIARNISCGRTKTTAIVKNVTGYHGKETLCAILRKNKFSIIVDESTDVGCTKHLCIVTRVYNGAEVVDAFFDLVPIAGATADRLYEHIKVAFTSCNILYQENIIGFAADGASVMMGARHSVSTLLKSEIPDLYVMKCICHSFHLCSSYACEKLPPVVEDLARDVYNYFQSSPKRIGQFKEFQSFVQVKPHKILHPSQTRWLSLHSVVARLLEQYNALKLFFVDAFVTDKVVAASTIYERLDDPINKLYFEFLDFVLPIFNTLNKEMQSQEPQIHNLRARVATSLKTLLDCNMKPNYLKLVPIENVEFKNPSNFLPIDKIYLGAKISVSIITLSQSKDLLTSIHAFQRKCLDFLIEGVNQIQKRFSFRDPIMIHLEALNPSNIMERKIQSIAPLASYFPNLISERHLQELDTEWRLLLNTEVTTDAGISVQQFWKVVKEMKYGDGSQVFPVLSKLVLNLLSLPHSSATVERIFSSVNLMKTKQRNKLTTKTLCGLLFTKQMCSKSSCYEIEIDRAVTNRMNVQMYQDSEDDE